jgi:hypothetical protein
VLSIELLTEGEPRLTCEGDNDPLINVIVRAGADEDRRVAIAQQVRRFASLFGYLIGVLAIGNVLVLALTPAKGIDLSLWQVNAIAFVLLVVGAAVITRSSRTFRKTGPEP